MLFRSVRLPSQGQEVPQVVLTRRHAFLRDEARWVRFEKSTELPKRSPKMLFSLPDTADTRQETRQVTTY